MRSSREQMLMDVAEVVAQRSTCLRRHVGAVIAREGRILSIGYNGAPAGMTHCTKDICNADGPCYNAVHAEANAIAWAARHGVELNESHLFVTLSPCLSCAQLIINAGIKAVYFQTGYRDLSGVSLLQRAGHDTIHLS